MKRLLACAIASELMVGALGVVAVTKGAPVARASHPAGLASLPLERDARASFRDSSHLTGSSPTASRSLQNTSSHHIDGQASRASDGSEPAGEISLAWPHDFATGANPSSAAFIQAAGDGLEGFQQTNFFLSDGVAVGDFNGDGHSDVAQTNVIAGSVSVFLGDGRGGFAAPAVFPVGGLPSFVLAGDLDGDGDLDLAVADLGTNDIALLQGDGTGKFVAGQRVPVAAPRNIAIGDVNADQVPDLVIASGGPACARPASTCYSSVSPAGGVVVLTGKTAAAGAVTFVPAEMLTLTQQRTGLPVGANFVALGDFDHRGADDLAVAVGTSLWAFTPDEVQVFVSSDGQNGQPFSPVPRSTAVVGGSPDALAVGDWNGDHRSDLAVLDNMSGDVMTMLGKGDGRFDVTATNKTVGSHPRSLVAADFDGDGIADLVTAAWDSSAVSVLRGKGHDGIGDGTFEPAVDFFAGGEPSAVGVGRFTRDGRVDVVVGRLRTDQLALLTNDGLRANDGVVVKRDIPYVNPTGDPLAGFHLLDVYVPPVGTVSFAGPGKPYPVFMWAFGGANITGDKSCNSYLMRTLARAGIVAVPINYRLGSDPKSDDMRDAFRWVRSHIGGSGFGGDPDRIVVGGTSAGAGVTYTFVSSPAYHDEQQHLGGVVLANHLPTGFDPLAAPTLLLNGTDGLEHATKPADAAAAAVWRARGIDANQVIVPDRDHLTQPAFLAVPGDPGRTALLNFLRTRYAAH